MSTRAITLAVLAVVVMLSFAASALAVPDTCPAGTHPLSPTTCLSDGRHVAPSSGHMIPDYSTAPVGRTALRLSLVAMGAIVSLGLVVLAIRKAPVERVTGIEPA